MMSIPLSFSLCVFALQVVTFDYGMKDENPIDHMRFYVKEQPHKAIQVRKDQVSLAGSS